MSALSDFIINFGDIVELNFPSWNLDSTQKILANHQNWVRYQPHKLENNRFGLSVTSLDGNYSGEPDLYSLREYRDMTGKNYNEGDFKRRTNIVNFIPELQNLLDFFEPNLGRTHFIKLNPGGFFPPHRDNGLLPSSPTFRIIVPIQNFHYRCVKWIQDEKIVNFNVGRTYFVNTTKVHSVFSFEQNVILLVLNVAVDDFIISKMTKAVYVT